MSPADEVKIKKTFLSINPTDYEGLFEAAQEFHGISKSEVAQYICDHCWYDGEILLGWQNIEKIFGVKIDLGKVVGRYISEETDWRDYPRGYLNSINEVYGCNVTIDKAIENIVMEKFIDSNFWGMGIGELVNFILENDGNPRLLIPKVVAQLDNPRICIYDIEDIIFELSPYIKDGDFDMEKLFSRIDWGAAKENEDIEGFTEFFRAHAPELAAHIPA